MLKKGKGKEDRKGDASMNQLTREQARRFLLCKQGLIGKYRFIGKEGAYQYVRQAGCIQFDPVDVCGRNAELTLQSRVKGFTRRMLSDLLYRERRLLDYSDKELSIWPREDWPYFSGYREKSREMGKQFPGIREREEEAIAYIQAHGPVSSDMLPMEGTVFWHSTMHWSGHWSRESQAARSVLEQLYTEGVLVIHHKIGSRKYYDLADKYLEPALLCAENPCRDSSALLAWRLKRRIGAVGFLWNRRSDAFLGIDMTAEQRDQAFSAMEAEGVIEALRVEGVNCPLYFLAEDKEMLQNVLLGKIDDKPRLEFLAPLDPMLWDRKLIRDLWDFAYAWEIYTPAAKRKYGYYVLPMLYGQQMIGRMEAIAHRKTKLLEVRNLWFEPGVRQTRKLEAAIHSAVKRLARLNDCEAEPIREGTLKHAVWYVNAD